MHRRFSGQLLGDLQVVGLNGEIVRLRNAGLISNQIMHRVDRELDVEDERLAI
jgi:hypothetical protein